MPAKSEAQKRLMDAAAHNPAFAQSVGVPAKVAKEFSSTSKGMKFGSGTKSRADLQKVNRVETRQGQRELFKKGGNTMAAKKMSAEGKAELAFMKRKKAPSSMIKSEMAEEGYKRGGAIKKMASGGFTRVADGVAQKGKTKAKQITMKRGGMCK